MIGPKPKIALFVGSDIVAHREMCAVVKHLVDNDFEPVLFYPKHLPSTNANAQQQIFKDYAYVERLILRESIFPYLEANPGIKAPFPTPNQLCARYGLQAPVDVDNINDPKFYEQFGEDQTYEGLISLRCTQIFKAGIIQTLKGNDCYVINAHSGILPDFRGLYSTPRAIFQALSDPQNAVGEFGCTIHHIEPFVPGDGQYNGIDTGNIIDLKSREIQPGQSVYAANIDLSYMAGLAVINTITRRINGESLRGYPNVIAQGNYFSYADAGELKQWNKAGLSMFDGLDEVTTILTQTFCDYRNQLMFEDMVRSKLDGHFGTRYSRPIIAGPQQNGTVNGANGHNTGAFARVAKGGNGNARVSKKPAANDTAKPVPLKERIGSALGGMGPNPAPGVA